MKVYRIRNVVLEACADGLFNVGILQSNGSPRAALWMSADELTALAILISEAERYSCNTPDAGASPEVARDAGDPRQE